MNDPRNVANGFEIPSENYCDQPYIVKTNDGAWLCVLTTGRGLEGDRGQHAVSSRSTDLGETWTELVDIESADSPESSWVMPLKIPSGRVYAIYNHNTDELQEVVTDYGPTKRVDTLGHFQMKYSDDNGLSWSKERYPIPIRLTEIDRINPYQGKIQFFWGVGKPMIHEDKAYFGYAKVGRFGDGFMATSEGYFVCSDNILTETDAKKVRWQLLPDGEIGLKAPKGPVADEHNLVALSDGSLYCTFRTVDGHNGAAYSRDGGHTWDGPQYARYAPGGQLIKHPRAANFVRKFSNGKFILWYHNNGTPWYPHGVYAGNRNVAWLAGGIEKDGYIHWSQPEIILYEQDRRRGPSYPDFIEEDGRYFISETQKVIARIHEVDAGLLEDMWNQAELKSVASGGVALATSGETDALKLPTLHDGGGFAFDFLVRFNSLQGGQVILDARANDGKGIALTTTEKGTIQISLNDWRMESVWDCDPGMLQPGQWHHVAVIVDGGPKVISFVVDGILCDGGKYRHYGWGRFGQDMNDVNGSDRLKIGPSLDGELSTLRYYNRYLRTSEAIGNFQAGR